MLFEARRDSNRVSTVTLIAIVVGEFILCLAVLFNVFTLLSSLLTQGTFISAIVLLRFTPSSSWSVTNRSRFGLKLNKKA